MRSQTSRLVILAAVALTQGCAFFAHPKVPSTDTNTIKIGLIASFSGNNAGSGATLFDAIDMALKQININGVLNGRKIEILRGDDKSDPATAVTVAADEISKGAVALIGPNSSGSAKEVLAKAAKPAGIPMISPNATSPDFSDPAKVDSGGFFFRTAPSDSLQGKVIAQKAKKLGYKKLAVIHTDNTYGNGLASVLEQSFGDASASVDVSYQFISDPQAQAAFDYTKPLGKVLDAKADAIVLVGFASDASIIINDWILDGRQQNVPWIFTDSTNRQDFIDNVKDKTRLEGKIGTAPYSDPAFVEKFKALYPNDPGVHGSPAFDAMVLIALAIAQAQSATPAAIRDHLQAVSGPSGTTIGPDDIAKGLTDAAAGKPIAYTGWAGPYNFDARGDMATGKYVIWTSQAGKVTTTSEILSP
jgi:ABC-type branched-subunit amino acid transport system substrate-binding protein